MALTKKTALFGRTRALERQIDDFLDSVSEAGLLFLRAFKIYMTDGVSDDFTEALNDVGETESRADELRRSIKAQLYEHTLIPDLRADVLSLLEHMDRLTGIFQNNCYRFAIEKPDIPEAFKRDFVTLGETAVTCADSLVMAARAFFRNIEAGARPQSQGHLLRDRGRQDLHQAEDSHLRLRPAAGPQDPPALLHRAGRRAGQCRRRRGRRIGHLHHQAESLREHRGGRWISRSFCS